MSTMASTIKVVRELVAIDADQRIVYGPDGRPALSARKYPAIKWFRLRWRVTGERYDRTLVLGREDGARAAEAHAELVACCKQGGAVGADGWPFTSTRPASRPTGGTAAPAGGAAPAVPAGLGPDAALTFLEYFGQRFTPLLTESSKGNHVGELRSQAVFIEEHLRRHPSGRALAMHEITTADVQALRTKRETTRGGKTNKKEAGGDKGQEEQDREDQQDQGDKDEAKDEKEKKEKENVVMSKSTMRSSAWSCGACSSTQNRPSPRLCSRTRGRRCNRSRPPVAAMDKELVSISEAARRLKVSRARIRAGIQSGEITPDPAAGARGAVLISSTDAAAYLESEGRTVARTVRSATAIACDGERPFLEERLEAIEEVMPALMAGIAELLERQRSVEVGTPTEPVGQQAAIPDPVHTAETQAEGTDRPTDTPSTPDGDDERQDVIEATLTGVLAGVQELLAINRAARPTIAMSEDDRRSGGIRRLLDRIGRR